MFDDVDGRLFGSRRSLAGVLGAITVFAAFKIANGGPVVGWQFVAAYVAASTFFSFLGAPMRRRRILRRHGYDPKNRLWMHPDVLAAMAPRPPRRTRVTPMAFTMAAALGVVAPFAVLSTLGVIGAGSNQSRQADGQVPATIAAVALALVVAAVGITIRPQLTGRLIADVEAASSPDFVDSDLPSAGGLGAIAAGSAPSAVWTLRHVNVTQPNTRH